VVPNLPMNCHNRVYVLLVTNFQGFNCFYGFDLGIILPFWLLIQKFLIPIFIHLSPIMNKSW